MEQQQTERGAAFHGDCAKSAQGNHTQSLLYWDLHPPEHLGSLHPSALPLTLVLHMREAEVKGDGDENKGRGGRSERGNGKRTCKNILRGGEINQPASSDH